MQVRNPNEMLTRSSVIRARRHSPRHLSPRPRVRSCIPANLREPTTPRSTDRRRSGGDRAAEPPLQGSCAIGNQLLRISDLAPKEWRRGNRTASPADRRDPAESRQAPQPSGRGNLVPTQATFALSPNGHLGDSAGGNGERGTRGPQYNSMLARGASCCAVVGTANARY